MDDIWPSMKREGGYDWSDMQALECADCQAERSRRRRVMCEGDDRHRFEPFVSAPYIHAMNWPKYHALTLRAVDFAKSNNRQLLWIVAMDRPRTREDKPMSHDRLQHRREQWLQLHDQATNGIMGVFPAVKGMPVRFTETTDREKLIFKNSRGKLKGWQLEQIDFERLQGHANPQEVLSLMPRALNVEIEGAEWVVDSSLGPGVYPLKPVKRTWAVDRAGHMKVLRFGFALVPDFAGTAHSYTGATLDAANGDAGSFDETPTRDKALRAYITVSRVEEADKLNIVQPYAPMLFRQGAQPGPHLLMDFLRGKIEEKDLENAWKQADAKHKKLPLDLKSVKWECSLCKNIPPPTKLRIMGKVWQVRKLTV